jgi:uncharacterized membrane protein
VKRVLLAVGALLLVAGCEVEVQGAGSADEAESEIRAVTVEATVNRDGSMDVVETLEYDFTADRNGGFRTFRPGGADYRIVDFEVTEDGERRDLAPGFDEPNFGGQVRWFGSGDHSKVSGRHDYELRYTVEGAVDVFPDTAQLEWQFVGSDFPQLDRVRIDVSFPGNGEGLRAFAHGVLHGVITPVGNEVALRVADNPGGRFVEADIVLPISNFDVAPTGPPSLDAILATEGALAQQANAEREAARQEFAELFADEVEEGVPGDCDGAGGELARRCDELRDLLEDAEPRVGQELDIDDADLLLSLHAASAAVDDEVDRIRDEQLRNGFNIGGVVVGPLAVIAFFVVWRAKGKDPERPADVGEYWRDLPAESPAVVASVDEFAGVDNKAFVATLVDLAQRGWVTITEEGDDHRFTRTQKAEGEPLKDYEAGLLWRLFAGGRPTITADELTEEAKADRSVSASWMQGWRAQVLAELNAQEYRAKTGCLPWLLAFVLVDVCVATGVFAFVNSAWVGGGVAIGCALVVLVCAPLLRRRTEKGVRKLAEVNALKKFLEDFSLVDDVPVGHLALYERYLVYAVALGVADRLIEGLRVRFPQVAEDPTFAPWYGGVYVGAGHGGGGIDRLSSLGSIDSFASSFTSSTSSAFSPPSSSSGGGGGFSGGGGGGGGGGGAGSW